MGWQAAPTLEKHPATKPRALLLACPSGEDNPTQGNAFSEASRQCEHPDWEST